MFTRSLGSVLISYVPPKKEPELVGMVSGGGNDDDYACNIGIDTNGFCDYGSPKEDPESKIIDVYRHPVKEEPELVAMGDDTDDGGGLDVGYDCSHCGIGLGTLKFKVEHEFRCKVLKKRKELESQITKLYHCGYCRCPFITKELKEQHQQKYCRKRPLPKKKPSNGPYFECDKCQYVAKQKSHLKEHLLTHNKNKAEWLTCTQCSYKTVHKQCMIRHTNIHSNIFSCCCPICGKSFRAKWCVDDHLIKQHSDESDEVAKLITSKVYTCDICSKYKTIRKNAFNEHLAIKHLKGVGSQKYECPRCPYSTFRKCQLNTHAKTHEEQKDYQCSICKKQFTLKQHLDSHILYIHIDNVDLVKTITSKIHHCESCSFKTVIKTHLKSHVQLKHI